MNIKHKLTVLPDPTDENHSFLLESINGYPAITQHGPIPNVLLEEVAHDLQEQFKNQVMDEWNRLKN